jgi:hypothetical protein
MWIDYGVAHLSRRVTGWKAILWLHEIPSLQRDCAGRLGKAKIKIYIEFA